MDAGRHRIKSYVLRQGRLTPAQKRSLEQLWPRYGIDFTAEPLDFESLYGRTAALTLEIGFGNGDVLLQQAISTPETDYFGIEVHRPGVGHLLRRAAEADVHNLRVINHDAVEVLRQQVPDNSLDCVQLFFPDPWHKKRHHKRRIVNPGFIQLVQRKLKTGGLFHLATDWQDYAEQMLMLMEQAEGLSNTAGQGNYADAAERPPTKFEQRGRRLGHGVWDLVFRKA
jgi:tRNA (guanine-N7-)-methyltransferase